jgi:hypothetical protein
MAKSKSDKAAASKAAWDKARQLAEKQGISVKEARSILAKNPDALESEPKKPGSKTESASKKQEGKTDKKTKPRAKKEVDLAAAEAKLREKYDHVIPGTIKVHTEGLHANRRTVEIKCANSECRNPKRRVATSDLWQVKLCEECTKGNRSKKRSKKTEGEVKGQ